MKNPTLLTQHDDGRVGLHTESDGHYAETADDFLADFGFALPPLPDGITHRLYEPGVRHALQDGPNVVDGGPMPWPPGDDALAQADTVIKAKLDKIVVEQEQIVVEQQQQAAASMELILAENPIRAKLIDYLHSIGLASAEDAVHWLKLPQPTLGITTEQAMGKQRWDEIAKLLDDLARR